MAPNPSNTTTTTATTNRAASAPASLPTGGRIIWLQPPLPGTYTTPSPPRTISPITPTYSPITPPAAAATTTTHPTYPGLNIHSTAPNTAPSALSALNSPVVLAEQRAPGEGSRRSLFPERNLEAMRRAAREMRDEDWEEGSEEEEEEDDDEDEDEMEGVEETEEEGEEDEEMEEEVEWRMRGEKAKSV